MDLWKGPLEDVSAGPLLGLRIDRSQPLGLQIERSLRRLVHSQTLPVGTRLPSTRSLAADLGVSRGVVVGAYDQLAAEGYIELRRGAVPTVAATGHAPEDVRVDPDVPIARARATCLPDFAFFPRTQWLAVMRATLQRARGSDFSYGEPFGAGELRLRLAPFLARTREVVAVPERTGIFAGASQALLALGAVLRARGARRLGLEDPSHRWRRNTVTASGLEVVPIPVDGEGLRVDRIPDVSAVLLTPDHQFPLGVALSPRRRRALVDWAVGQNKLVIEHDYDAHFGYEQRRAGALQALAPEHVAYVGSTSALLAPAVRIGWAVLPARLVEPVAHELFVTAIGAPRLTQLAFAEFIARGYLDRHLRRTLSAFKRRREALVAALARGFPQATLQGEATGLYLSVALPDGTDEARFLAAARRRGVALDGFEEHGTLPHRPGAALGFASAPEPTLEYAVELLRAAWEEAAA